MENESTLNSVETGVENNKENIQCVRFECDDKGSLKAQTTPFSNSEGIQNGDSTEEADGVNKETPKPGDDVLEETLCGYGRCKPAPLQGCNNPAGVLFWLTCMEFTLGMFV